MSEPEIRNSEVKSNISEELYHLYTPKQKHNIVQQNYKDKSVDTYLDGPSGLKPKEMFINSPALLDDNIADNLYIKMIFYSDCKSYIADDNSKNIFITKVNRRPKSKTAKLNQDDAILSDKLDTCLSQIQNKMTIYNGEDTNYLSKPNITHCNDNLNLKSDLECLPSSGTIISIKSINSENAIQTIEGGVPTIHDYFDDSEVLVLDESASSSADEYESIENAIKLLNRVKLKIKRQNKSITELHDPKITRQIEDKLNQPCSLKAKPQVTYNESAPLKDEIILDIQEIKELPISMALEDNILKYGAEEDNKTYIKEYDLQNNDIISYISDKGPNKIEIQIMNKTSPRLSSNKNKQNDNIIPDKPENSDENIKSNKSDNMSLDGIEVKDHLKNSQKSEISPKHKPCSSFYICCNGPKDNVESFDEKEDHTSLNNKKPSIKPSHPKNDDQKSYKEIDPHVIDNEIFKTDIASSPDLHEECVSVKVGFNEKSNVEDTEQSDINLHLRAAKVVELLEDIRKAIHKRTPSRGESPTYSYEDEQKRASTATPTANKYVINFMISPTSCTVDDNKDNPICGVPTIHEVRTISSLTNEVKTDKSSLTSDNSHKINDDTNNKRKLKREHKSKSVDHPTFGRSSVGLENTERHMKNKEAKRKTSSYRSKFNFLHKTAKY